MIEATIKFGEIVSTRSFTNSEDGRWNLKHYLDTQNDNYIDYLSYREQKPSELPIGSMVVTIKHID